MENDKEKKGLFERLLGKKKEKKGSCCCNIELEEVPDNKEDTKDGINPKNDDKGGSCCC